MFRHDPDSTTSMPPLLVLGAALLLLVRVGIHVHPPKPAPEMVNWRGLAEGIEESERTGRPLLVDVSANWCEPCVLLDRQVFRDRELAALIEKRFVPVRIIDQVAEAGANPPAIQEWIDRRRITGFPTLVIEASGRRQLMLPGYPGRARTRAFLESALTPKP